MAPSFRIPTPISLIWLLHMLRFIGTSYNYQSTSFNRAIRLWKLSCRNHICFCFECNTFIICFTIRSCISYWQNQPFSECYLWNLVYSLFDTLVTCLEALENQSKKSWLDAFPMKLESRILFLNLTLPDIHGSGLESVTTKPINMSVN